LDNAAAAADIDDDKGGDDGDNDDKMISLFLCKSLTKLKPYPLLLHCYFQRHRTNFQFAPSDVTLLYVSF